MYNIIVWQLPNELELWRDCPKWRRPTLMSACACRTFFTCLHTFCEDKWRVSYQMIVTIIGLNVVVVWVPLLLHALQVVNPNLISQNGFPDRYVSYFCSVASCKYWNICIKTTSFHYSLIILPFCTVYCVQYVAQARATFLPWTNHWNNFQVSGKPLHKNYFKCRLWIYCKWRL
jgi:hypothetical protein